MQGKSASAYNRELYDSVWEGQRLEQDAVHQADHRSVPADAQGERDHGGPPPGFRAVHFHRCEQNSPPESRPIEPGVPTLAQPRGHPYFCAYWSFVDRLNHSLRVFSGPVT
mgnify:CR=1 FL=1